MNSVTPGGVTPSIFGHIHGHVARASGDVAPRCDRREISEVEKKTYGVEYARLTNGQGQVMLMTPDG